MTQFNRNRSLPCILFAWVGVASVPAHASHVSENLVRLPLAFEQHGERFVARGQGYTVGVDSGKMAIQVLSAKDKTSRAVSLEFAGTGVSRAVPGAKLPGKVNYILGEDPRKWQTGLPTYGLVTYPNTYPGIDVVYHGNQQQLEFDLVVRPGADPRAIRMKIKGGSGLSIDASGALVVGDSTGDLRIALPETYQDVNGTRKSISGHYSLHGRDEVVFNVDRYDRNRPLVIDPTIVYSTLLGGSTGSSASQSIALDSLGQMYIAGYTSASDFPIANAYQGGLNVNQDAFVTVINAAGTALVYSTYIGGSNTDQFQGIAVDSTGAAWVAGSTSSFDFPLLNATQAASGGGQDAVLVKLNPSGTLAFSTYLGGSNTDQANGVAIDSSGSAYVTGQTLGDFPATSGVLQSTNQGSWDAFIAKFTTNGAETYATLLGGSGTDEGIAIAADTAGNAYVTGLTYSATIPGAPAGGAQTTLGGLADAFVAKFNPSGTALQYFTFLGGTGLDQGNAIAVDINGDAYFAGYTGSAGLATAGAAQPAIAGGYDGFAAELNPAGTAFTYVTYLGGNRQDQINGMALDSAGNIYLAGQTDSTNFPTISALQPVLPGNGVSLAETTNSGATWAAFDTNIPGAVFDMSPDPVNPGTFVVGTEQGIYRTTNGGAVWTQQFPGVFLNVALSRSPANSNTIYAEGQLPCSSCTSSGIYLSTDNGVTWTLQGPSPTRLQTGSSFIAGGIVADPVSASTAYVFSFYPTVFKTTDSGVSWYPAATGLPIGGLQALVAASDGSLYAAIYNSTVYKSTNQGDSWTPVNTGLPGSGLVYAHSLSVSPSDPATLYLAAGTVYKTTNGGASWAAIASGFGYKGEGALEIAVSPLNASVLYGWGVAYLLSTDGGVDWTAATVGASSAGFAFDPFNAANVFALAGTTTQGFVAKLNRSGSALTYSTYLGGTASAYAMGIATNGTGGAFATGYTSDTLDSSFPVTSSTGQSSSNAQVAFVTEISDTTDACSYSVNPAAQVLSGATQLASFSVVAPGGCAWTVTSDQSWAIFPNGASGTGTAGFYVQIAANTTGAGRSANLTLGGKTVTVQQADSSCSYVLSATSVSLTPGGGPVSVDLTTGSGCPWSVSTGTSAISVTSAATGTGSATITMTVAPNLGTSSRTFSVAVATAGIQLNEAAMQTITFGALSNQTLGASPIPLTATASSGLDVTFTSNTTTVCTVSGNTAIIVASGGCSITASQAGNATYAAAAPVIRAFTVLFNDVAPTAYYYTAVNLFAQYGITAGCGNNNFCPDDNVTRAQMAVFIVTAIFGSNTFSYSTTPHFADVGTGDFAFKFIQAMYELGITAGCGNGNYCPDDPVTRDSMSVFIIVARLGTGAAFTYPVTPYFTDEPATDFAFKFVQRMKLEGITGGCTTTTFCPDSSVTRGQMAVFMMVGLFNQLLQAGTPVLTAISPSTLGPGATGTFTITGANTNFAQGTTALSPIPGVTIGTITVNSPTSLTVQLTAAGNAAAQPRSIVAITGAEQDVLPNGLVIQ
jgi:Beta-propeller repeat/S-layer homology domain